MAQADCAMFEEDEVCKRFEDKILYGIVTESSEFLSSDEEDDDEEMLSRGMVRVIWHPDGTETVEEEKKITLVDRSLMPGDVIRRLISGKNSQRGYVQDLEVKCHLHIKGSNKYIYNVDARHLLPLREYDFDDDVSLEPWYGKVETATMQARVVFPDGAQCIAEEEELYDMDMILDDCNSDNEMIPGTVLKGERDTLKKVKWIHETNTNHRKMSSAKNIHVRVEENLVKSVQVNWICRGYNTAEDVSKLQIPNIVEKEQLDKLKKLGKFQHCSVQINDIMRYNIVDTDVLSEDVPGSDINSTLNQINSMRSSVAIQDDSLVSHHSSQLVCNESINTSLIQDSPVIHPSSEPISSGTCEANVIKVSSACPSSEPVSSEIVESSGKKVKDTDNENVDGARCSQKKDLDSGVETQQDSMMNGIEDDDEEFDESLDVSGTVLADDQEEADYEDIPEQTKEKRKRLQKRSAKGRRKKKKTMEFQTKFPECRPGETVPVVVFCTVSIATVMWQDGSVEKEISSAELYPIHHLDEHEFFPGDFVVEAKEESDKPNYYGAIVSCDHQARTCMVNWYKIENGVNIRTSEEAEEVSVYDIKDHPEYKFRPGDIVVAVGDPKKSDVGNHSVGQIASLVSQGGLYVRWPDSTTSFCNPQELYLVGGDMSEFDSDSESSDFSSDSDDSWETEEEEEEEGGSENEDESRKPTPVRKEELESLLDRATAALSKLDDLFQTLPQSIDATQCFQEIIYIYKKCRELEKILKSSFYKEEEIVSLIDEAKKQLRKSRTEKYNRRIEELSKQLKEVSQNLQVDLHGLMKTVSVTDQQEGSGGDVKSETDMGRTGTDTNVRSETDMERTESDSKVKSETSMEMTGSDANVKSETDLGRTSVDMEADDSSKMLAENDEGSMHSVCEFESDLGRTDETIDTAKGAESATAEQVPPGGEQVGVTEMSKEGATGIDSVNKPTGSGIDLETQTLCLKICGHLQDRMKRILEEVVPRWIAEGNILVDDEMCKRTSQMSVSEENEVSLDIPEENQSVTESSDIQEVTSPMTPTDIPEIVDDTTASRFIQESETPACHKFYAHPHLPSNLNSFTKAVSKEMRLLQRCLPEGITVKGYEDRMDLYSVMIIGPKKTPYEDAPFFFDIQLPNDYPKSPPLFHYISFCTDRLNPNLYDDGKVCVSLLGTWEGKDTETWTSNSSLLQVFVSIQGLILVDEPYYNEAGYEKHRGTQQGAENSKMYNEMAILKLVESLTNMIKNIPVSFRTECVQHLMKNGPRMLRRLVYWSTNPDPKRSETSIPSCKPNKNTADRSSEEIEASASLVEPVVSANQKSANLLSTAHSEVTANQDDAMSGTVQSDESSSQDLLPGATSIDKDIDCHRSNPNSISQLANENSGEGILSNENSATTSLSSSHDVSMDSEQMLIVEFPLFPLSRGFCITMNKKLYTLKSVLNSMIESHKTDS